MVIAKFIKGLQVRLESIPALGAVVYNAIVKRILSKSELEIETHDLWY